MYYCYLSITPYIEIYIITENDLELSATIFNVTHLHQLSFVDLSLHITNIRDV